MGMVGVDHPGLGGSKKVHMYMHILAEGGGHGVGRDGVNGWDYDDDTAAAADGGGGG